MDLSKIINSVSTDIYFHGHSPGEFISDIMKYFYNDGFQPRYLLCNPKDLKIIKYIFKKYKRFDLGKDTYDTDFGILTIIPIKEKTIGYVTITDKDC